MRKKPLYNYSGDPFPPFSPEPFQHPSQLDNPITPQAPKNAVIQTDPLNSSLVLKTKPSNQSLRKLINQENQRSTYQTGTEINRLTNTIAKLASRQKINFSSKENSLPPTRINSLASQYVSSETSLPRLDRTFNDREETSKLMQQIRRVQNRIKQLKFQRNQATQHQNNFEMIRPFLQIQNQNMINLQMMILAQNSHKNQPHYCCPAAGSSYAQQNEYSPYSVRQVSQNQTDSERQIEEGYGYSNKPYIQKRLHKKTHKKRFDNKPSKKYNLKKLRKFRVAVIAVYFYLLFPKYSNKFTLARYHHHQKIFFLNKPKPEANINLFIDEILNLNSIKIAQYVRMARMDKTQRRVAKTAKLIITEQYEGKRNFEFYIGDVEMFLLQFLKKFEEIVDEGGLQGTLKFIGKVDLPTSFPVDDFHLLDQIFRMSFHPQKLYLKLSKEQSKALIISTLLVKLLIFSYLFIIKDSFELKKKLLKQNKLKTDQMIEVELAATEMYFSGILLHRYCMDLIREMMETSEGNAPTIDQNNLPIPKPMLIFNHFGQIEKALGANISDTKIKRKASAMEGESSSEASYGRLQIQQYEDDPLYLFSYIRNLEHFQDLIKLIKKSSDYELQIKDKIMDITDKVYERMIGYRREDYQKIKQQMLLDEKNLLRHKITVNELKMPKRSNEEKKFMKKIMNIINQNKENQEEYVVEENSQKQEEEQEEEKEEEEEEEEEEEKTDKSEQNNKKAKKKAGSSSSSSSNSSSNSTVSKK